MEFDLNRFLLANFLQKKQEAGSGFIFLGCSYNSFFLASLLLLFLRMLMSLHYNITLFAHEAQLK
jgi:hypothetical protein